MFEINLVYLFISLLLGFGFAVAIVEKGREWPLRKINVILRRKLNKYIDVRAHRLLLCVVCTSFWATLFSDLVLYAYTGEYFFWPFSGFINVGLSWLVVEFLFSHGHDIE